MTEAEYLRNKFARCRYFKRYGNREIKKNRVFDNKTIVYTSITGNYDSLRDRIYFDSNVEYVCFTNNREIKSTWWNEVGMHSNRDQISFPYCCWKDNFIPDICGKDLYNNQWLLWLYVIRENQ